jgi:hypothetical protein
MHKYDKRFTSGGCAYWERKRRGEIKSHYHRVNRRKVNILLHLKEEDILDDFHTWWDFYWELWD